jgi:hypothetical protein
MKCNRGAKLAVTALGAVIGLGACNVERRTECDKFLSALKSLDPSAPTVETVGRVHDALVAIQFQDEPLREYAKNAAATLTVLSNTLALGADPLAPDGTMSVVKETLRQAQGERDDVAKYCAP